MISPLIPISLCPIRHLRYISRFFEGDQLQAAMQAGQDAGKDGDVRVR